MTGKEIKQALGTVDTERQPFLKWWRKENDFADVELVEQFLREADPDLEFGGYELLNMEQMWDLLKRQSPHKVNRDEQWRKEVIVWNHPSRDGAPQQVCPFTAESLLTIFNVETKGNPIC
jgi:hypothetical protein